MNHEADVLRAILVAHEERVGRVDDHEIVHPDERDQTPRAVDHAPPAVDRQRAATDRVVTVASRAPEPFERGPAAHVGPREPSPHDRHAGGALEDAGVDGHRTEPAVRGGQRGGVAPVERPLERGDQSRQMGAQRAEDGRGTPREDTAVPEHASRGEQRGGAPRGRFLDERLDPRDPAGRPAHRAAGSDVAVAGLRTRRPQPQGDERVGPLGDVEGQPEVGAKAGTVVDRVIGGQHRDHRVVPVAHQVEGGERDGRRGVAAFRLDEHLPTAERRQLGAHRACVVARGHDADPLSWDDGGNACDGVLEHRPGTDDREQLLRHAHATARPEARPGASGQDDRVAQGAWHRSVGRERPGVL